MVKTCSPPDESLSQDFKPLDTPHFQCHPILVFSCLMHGKAWFLQPDMTYDLDDMVGHLAIERDPMRDVACEVHHSIGWSYTSLAELAKSHAEVAECRHGAFIPASTPREGEQLEEIAKKLEGISSETRTVLLSRMDDVLKEERQESGA